MTVFLSPNAVHLPTPSSVSGDPPLFVKRHDKPEVKSWVLGMGEYIPFYTGGDCCQQHQAAANKFQISTHRRCIFREIA